MTWTGRLWRRVGRRGCALLFFALIDIIYAFSLFNPPAEARLSPTLAFIDSVLPLWAWGTLWLASGLICLAQAPAHRDRIAYGAAILVKVTWGALYIIGWSAGAIERAYVGLVVWWGFAAFVALISGWPEPDQTPPPRRDQHPTVPMPVPPYPPTGGR